MYKIPRRTINYKLKNKHMNQIGTPNVFTVDEETCFINCIIYMSDFGFPIGESDLKCIVKDYLTKICKNVNIFKNTKTYKNMHFEQKNIKNHMGRKVNFFWNICIIYFTYVY